MKPPKVVTNIHLLLIVTCVAVWWIANTLTAISAKTFMENESIQQPGGDKNSWSEAIRDFRWLELTFSQHLLGAFVSALWIKIVLRKSIWPSADSSKKVILLASIGNVVGNMVTNMAYTIVSSNMTQVVKYCEPLFMFVFSLLLYRDGRVLTLTTFLTIVVMVVGATLFIANNNSTFLFSGLFAALCSNTAFPIRNIYLQKLTTVWESAIQKYAVVSCYSVVILAPVILVKSLNFHNYVSLFSTNWHQDVISSSFHCLYNIASIHVLQNLSPLSHSILNFIRLGIVNSADLAFVATPLSWSVFFGLVAIVIGLYFYLRQHTRNEKVSLAILFTTATFGLFLLFSKSSSQPDKVPIVSTNVFILPNNLPISETEPSRVIHSAWVFDRPLSKTILANLQNLTQHSPITVHCGTSRCMRAIEDLSNNRISAEFLNIRDLVEGITLEKWLEKHILYKVLAQKSFEYHLQEVAKLGILWKYGGVYVEPNVELEDNSDNPFQSCTKEPWIKLPPKNDGIQLFQLACFPAQHPFIGNISTMIENEYFFKNNNKQVADIGMNYVTTLLIPVNTLKYRLLSMETDQPWNHHYGTLSYTSRVVTSLGANVGDEIQGFPGLQFLPYLDNFLERDRLAYSRSEQKITAFFNAWWGSLIAQWPPPPNVDPLLFSIHIGSDMHSQWRSHTNYLIERGPIGCRDDATLQFLTTLGVPAYFSGCMTLMLQRKSVRMDTIYITDVKDEYINMLPKEIQEKGVRVHHDLGFSLNKEYRTRQGFEIIDQYSSAKLVITQRIHSALPCVAMGTPVIFINSDKMPGGGGTSQASSSRIVGLSTMFHTFDNYKMTREEGMKWFAEFPWDDPPPNPDIATVMRLRATFWYQIRQRPSLFDAARKLGLIPMSPPSPCQDRRRFHIHFQDPDEDFTWQDHRSIESVFRHHPCANVLVHSNTLNNKRFDVFREAGYKILVAQYDFDVLLNNITALKSNQPEGLYTKENVKNLLPAVVLYKWGGIYMDSNVVITQPLDKLPTNFVIRKQNPQRTKLDVNLSFVGFEKQSRYLELVMSNFASNVAYPSSSMYAQRLMDRNNVTVIEAGTEFIVIKECNAVNQSSVLRNVVAVAMPSNHSFTDSIGTTTPLLSGSLCQQVLQHYCVICSKLL